MLVDRSTLTGCVAKQEDRAKGEAEFRLIYPPWKRFLDLFLIILLLPVWLPLMLIIAAGIKVVSPKGPILFRQSRIGYRGRTFWCLKFRSMHCSADGEVHKAHLKKLMQSGTAMVKLDGKGDPRLIPCGGLLRASGLDELPQIFTVLRGEMSMVGPRPCMPYEYDEYLPWQKERCEVLPGLTGLWQVKGKNQTTFEEMIRLDVEYGRSLSLKRDLWILFKTFGVLFRQTLDLLRHKPPKKSV